jgi:endonuclease YncB( thermonuclease family)
MRVGQLISLAVLVSALPAFAEQPGTAKAYLNGVATPVFFNDGDSFRILAGEHQGSQCRLAGFNTLESFGAAHSWGTWTPGELYRNAKMATMSGRRGVWHCESDLSRDGYGRMLWWCKDLALSQVKNGYAMAMSVTEEPADPDVIAVQNEAIAAKRGMWAHGVPDYVMTSNHSFSENFPGNYNRLVSTVDGRSKKWLHQQNYAECQTPCAPSEDPDATKIAAFAKELKAGPGAALFQQWDEATLVTHLTEYILLGSFGELPAQMDRFAVESLITPTIAAGRLRTSGLPTSCMIYVDFTRRYGANRAACLRK